ncbi:glycosyltransferase family 4 protein [Paenactinomyces guangxiensis]|uniref:Glycosyltransferase family 4 protein n=1 Tax=Paenactinomyces guangxiensis TaxID=1490290 RepID=A0A7W1WSV9_9BACL|nr:glycosyltransferase family 4 protein [Paenactinomyces guangxiensis]MBA4495359.1 glycosyltransferase family 4 protein [Paenactinomyces guangxiensis]MBH8592520.1 glycosyltransferase family 4 protein [Paenactinomyces guangxiensis]
MRIWLANHYAVPPNIAGITRHYELAKEWAVEEEAEVTLFLSKFVHPRRTFITEEEKNSLENIKGLKLEWLWSFPHKTNDVRRMVNMASFAVVFFLAGLLKKRPDVLIASSPHLFTAFAGWMLSRIKRCPFVFEVRDLWPDSLIKMGGLKNKYIARVLTWMESFLYQNADQIIVLTEHQRKFIADKGIDPSKIHLIPNGIVVGSWKPDPVKRAEFKRKMGVPEDQFVAIYTGAHGPANALQYVVQAGRYLKPGISIVLIGDGPEKEKLLKIKQEESLDNVHLLDPVPKSEIFDYTQAADCGIISLADNEVFRGARPNKLFDYTFVGIPIVTTVDGEVREIVESNQVGVFAGAENPQGLAEAIDRVRSYTPEQLEQIKRNGREYIDREGDRKKLAHRFYGLLQSLANLRK